VSTRDKNGISAPHNVGRGCSELMFFVWILARGALLLQVFRVSMCPAVGVGMSARCFDGGYSSGGC
jgi:hypothetical protein